MKTASGVRRWVPMVEWLPRYRPVWLTADLLAGLTVWALIVPESMAYANVAGVPVQYGLYAVPLAVLGYAIFGSSRQLFVGPSSTVAALSAATIAPLAVSTGANPVALTATLALVVGGLYVVGGVLRLGFIARFFAKPVLDGFIVGLGIFIAVGQLPKLVGVEKSDGNTIRQLLSVIGDVGSWDWLTVGVGVASLIVLVGLDRLLPRVPGALVVTVLAIAATQILDLAGHGLAIVGPVPTGFDFVPWTGITWDAFVDMIPGALAILVVGFAEGVAIAKSYAAKYDYRIDPNQEMLAYGAASIGAGMLQGYTVSASLSKSAAADDAGGKTPVALAVVSVMVLLTILLIAGVFEHLPEATLAAIVIAAVSGMIDFRTLGRLRAARVVDFWLAVGSLVGVLVLGILPGIVGGVVLSLVLFIHRLDHPHIARLGRNRERTEFGDLEEHPQFVEVPGVMVLRVDAPLIFANADAFADSIEDTLERAEEREGARPRALVLDLEACFEIDVTGVDALSRVAHLLDQKGVELHLARAKAPVRAVLEHLGATATIGPDHLHATVSEAVAATEGRE
ncbi:MAG: sodium-independent anion transporter [Acidimicrobiia bacterium]